MTQLLHIPQLFYNLHINEVILLLVKIVDDLLIVCPHEIKLRFIKAFNSKFTLSKITHARGILRFYALNFNQGEYFIIIIDGDENLRSLEAFSLFRAHNKDTDGTLSTIDLSWFMSVNISIGWIGVTASKLCSFYVSYLQQKMQSPTIKDLFYQLHCINDIQSLESRIKLSRPTFSTKFKFSILIFADDCRQIH